MWPPGMLTGFLNVFFVTLFLCSMPAFFTSPCRVLFSFPAYQLRNYPNYPKLREFSRKPIWLRFVERKYRLTRHDDYELKARIIHCPGEKSSPDTACPSIGWAIWQCLLPPIAFLKGVEIGKYTLSRATAR